MSGQPKSESLIMHTQCRRVVKRKQDSVNKFRQTVMNKTTQKMRNNEDNKLENIRNSLKIRAHFLSRHSYKVKHRVTLYVKDPEIEQWIQEKDKL
jgi:hypothetical protein